MRIVAVVLLALAVLFATASLATSPDSFLFVSNGQAITNGAPVDVKALKVKHSGSFFWFSLDGRQYITRDPATLAQIRKIYEPVFSFGWDFPLGEQMAVMTKQLRVKDEQERIGLTPRPGEPPSAAARRDELAAESARLRARQNELAARANVSAAKANEYAARLPDMNRQIERQLHDLAVRLVRERNAVEIAN